MTKGDPVTETVKDDELLSRLSRIREKIGDIPKEDIDFLMKSTLDREIYRSDGYSKEFKKSMKKLDAFRKKKQSQ